MSLGNRPVFSLSSYYLSPPPAHSLVLSPSSTLHLSLARSSRFLAHTHSLVRHCTFLSPPLTCLPVLPHPLVCPARSLPPSLSLVHPPPFSRPSLVRFPSRPTLRFLFPPPYLSARPPAPSRLPRPFPPSLSLVLPPLSLARSSRFLAHTHSLVRHCTFLSPPLTCLPVLPHPLVCPARSLPPSLSLVHPPPFSRPSLVRFPSRPTLRFLFPPPYLSARPPAPSRLPRPLSPSLSLVHPPPFSRPILVRFLSRLPSPVLSLPRPSVRPSLPPSAFSYPPPVFSPSLCRFAQSDYENSAQYCIGARVVHVKKSGLRFGAVRMKQGVLLRAEPLAECYCGVSRKVRIICLGS